MTSKCHTCGKTVYAMERMDVDGKTFHKTCMKCEHCQCKLSLGNYAALNGKYYCKTHFKQLFKTKGNYNDGFGEEDAKKRWSPQISHFNMSGMNFSSPTMKPRAVTVGPILQQGSYRSGEDENKEFANNNSNNGSSNGDSTDTNTNTDTTAAQPPAIVIDEQPASEDDLPISRGVAHTISVTPSRRSDE